MAPRLLARRIYSLEARKATFDVHENLLETLDETGVWRFLAARIKNEYIVAPPEVRERLQRFVGSLSNCFNTMPTKLPAGANLFVWDLDPLELERAQQLNAASRVFGILRDVWCADLTGSDVFAPTPPQPRAVVNYAILCPPRSGSTFLCELLKQAGFGNPAEHVRPFFVELCRAGWAFPDVMDLVIRRGSRAGYFGTKLISHYIAELAEVGVPSETVERYVMQRNFRVIRLLRDPAEQVISSLFAAHTGIWHQRGLAEDEARYAAVPYDGAELQEGYYWRTAENRYVMEVGNRLAPVLDIDYHDLDRDPHSTVAAAAAFLGAPLGDAFRLDRERATRKISASQPRMQEYLVRLKGELAERLGERTEYRPQHATELFGASELDNAHPR